MRTTLPFLATLMLMSLGLGTGRARAGELGEPLSIEQGEQRPRAASSAKPRFDVAAWFRSDATEGALWVRNPDAARWALDGTWGFGVSVPGGMSATDVDLSARFAFVPGLSLGGSVGYQRRGDDTDYPAEFRSTVFPGAFLEVHAAPGSPVDLWLRVTGGVGIDNERHDQYYRYASERSGRMVRGFFEGALGFAAGSRFVRIGPFVAVGTRRLGLGLRVDLLFPVERDPGPGQD